MIPFRTFENRSTNPIPPLKGGRGDVIVVQASSLPYTIKTKKTLLEAPAQFPLGEGGRGIDSFQHKVPSPIECNKTAEVELKLSMI